MKRTVIGGDIGGTHARFAIVDEAKNIISTEKIRIRHTGSAQDFLEQIVSALEKVLNTAQARDCDVQAIGLGIAGKVDSERGIVIFSPNIPEARNLTVAEKICSRVNMRVFIDNDANAFGRGEVWAGDGALFKDWLGITLGTGVGGCLVLSGKVWTGEEGIGFAAEIGHTTVYPGGLQCLCGKLGCLEAYASEGGIIRMIQRQNIFPEKQVSTSRQLYELALTGDERALELFKIAGKALGIAIANAFTLLGIRKAIIGGGVSRAWVFMEPATKDALREHMSMLDLDEIILKTSTLGDTAALLGAAKLALDGLAGAHPRK
ncbi:MAG TPA: ROK family protein [Thermodesulforhabdus norvegica]|uniref:ROK family protein n=1 Tax=Thermodesulforhabdus norvegica TaxID=39841 RepID=A0A7C1AUL2_9BACT|nr:ROK family protein [Thermodesulforhabdus norvegica]